MKKNIKTYFQDIHYSRKRAYFPLNFLLGLGELFYKNIIAFKNYLYKVKLLKETKVGAYVICVGNLTTGGVGKTPITIELANKFSGEKKVAIISRGYASKLNTKNPQVIKDLDGIKYKDGSVCGDEPYQIAVKTNDNITVIICKDRLKSCIKAINEYGCNLIIMDDGFSNRKVYKDKTIVAIDSKMKFGNGHMLPKGPLREPENEIKRADEIYIVNKEQSNTAEIIEEFKKYGKKISLCNVTPHRIYNLQTHATIKQLKHNEKVVAFCAIGQPLQFFNFLKKYYEVIPVIFEDHHKYTKKDIEYLKTTACKNKATTLITTQKDETKIKNLLTETNGFSFNVLELKNEIIELN